METNRGAPKIIVCAPINRNVRKILKNSSNFKWVFLSEDVSTSIVIKKIVGGNGEQIDITGILQKMLVC